MTLDEMAARLADLTFLGASERFPGECDLLTAQYHAALDAQPERKHDAD